VIELEDVPPGKLTFLPEGSISIFVAQRRSPSLEALHSTLRGSDYDAFREALGTNLKRLSRLIGERKPFHGGSFRNAPVLGDVSYKGRILSRAFMVSETLPVNFAFLPYLGGDLDHEGFELTQYAKRSGALEALIILRKPKLTRVEQDLLKQIPPEQSSLQIGDAGIYANCIIAATLTVLALAAGIYVTYIVYNQMRAERERQDRQNQQDRQAQQQQDQQQQRQQEQQQQQQDQQQQQQEQEQQQQEQGGQDQQNQQADGGSAFYRGLSDLAYQFGSGEIDVTASVQELLQLRTTFVRRYF
jgi:hypothetical protein